MTARARRPDPTGLQVMVAVPSPHVAARIATLLLERRLCACAQTLGPIQSRYAWKGRLETAREWLLLIKTRPALFAAVARAVRRAHPYELPEIVATPMRPALRAYLDWIEDVTTPAPKRPRRAPRRARRA